MPTFRFHCGSLEESLKTCEVVNNKRELWDYIFTFNKLTGKRVTNEDVAVISVMVNPDNIKIIPYGFDERIGWNTHMVLICNQCVTKDPYVIGFLSDNFPEQEKNEIPNS